MRAPLPWTLLLLLSLPWGPSLRAAELAPELRTGVRPLPRHVLLHVTEPHPPDLVCVGPICRSPLHGRASLEKLESQAGVLSIHRPARYRLRLDRAPAWIGLRQSRLTHEETGRGVLIALLDTGLDWRHQDFLDAGGQSRVRWLLDQSMEPQGLHPDLENLGAGAVFSRAELQAILDGEEGPAAESGRDLFGHGTHIAGIAAGDDPQYTGVAPEAELIVVKTVDGSGQVDEDRVLAGLAFCLEAARRAQMPLVVNLSLGDQLGAHDGTSPLELALSAAAASSQPPCAVTVAAGNEGMMDWHARLRLDDGQAPSLLSFRLPETAGRPARILVDLWASLDGPLCLDLLSPQGDSLLSHCLSAQPTQFTQQTAWGTAGLATQLHTDKAMGRLLLELGGQELSGGEWSLRLWGKSRRVDAWIADFELDVWPWPAFTNHLDRANLVGPPATAHGVVAVGAFTAREGWVDLEGTSHRVDGWPGLKADFSSPGPSLDGRLKPDLLAPGLSVASSLSADSDPGAPESIFYAGGGQSRILPDGRHGVASGTSMAAPFAAGLAALILQSQPQLTGVQVKQRLLVGTRGDLGGPRDAGLGGLFAPAALAPTAGSTAAPMAPDKSPCRLSQGWLARDAAHPVQLVFVPRDEKHQALGPDRLAAMESDPPGAPFAGPVQDLGDGIYVRQLGPGGEPGASFVFRCELDSQRSTEAPRLRIGSPQAQQDSPSCGTSGAEAAGSSGLAAWLFFLSLAGLLSRSRRAR